MSNRQPSLTDAPIEAVAQWRALLGDARCLTGEQLVAHYGPGTSPHRPDVPATLFPTSVDEIVDIVAIARQCSAPLYPVSTGRNWGYGDANPVLDGCTLVDLSRMNRILAFDHELGLVTLEPGVTQADLHRYLEAQGLDWMVPTTGAGPTTSLLGNALERGYGSSPIRDHFQGICSLEAVLATGEIYRGAFAAMGCTEIDRAYKWGVGPYLDGLFSQGNFGIVTQVTLQLKARPEHIELCYFRIARDEDLDVAIAALRQVLAMGGDRVGGVGLMSGQRLLAFTMPYPYDRVQPGSAMSPELKRELAERYHGSAWVGSFALTGPKSVVRALRGECRKLLRGKLSRMQFLSPGTVRLAERALSLLPGRLTAGLLQQIGFFNQNIAMMLGVPQASNLKLAYWRARVPQLEDPGRDGCGIAWYTPLMPFKADRVRALCRLIERVCAAHGFDPLIALVSVSDSVLDCNLPLLFDRNDPAEARRANACVAALFEAGRAEGFMPYRYGIETMSQLVDETLPCWKLVQALKAASDPLAILAPGRYAPLPAPRAGGR